MGSEITTLNSTQKLDLNRSGQATFVNGGVTERTIYTCPSGFVAKVVSYKSKMGALGAGTYLRFKAAGVVIRNCTAPDVNEASAVEMAGAGIRLAAGETLSYIGDAGANNEDGSYFYALQELPA